MPRPTIDSPDFLAFDSNTACPARPGRGWCPSAAARFVLLACAALVMPLRAHAVVCTGDYSYQDAVTEGCAEINGNLAIDSTSLTSLTGLSGLNAVTGNISIYDNDSLTSFAGLDSLSSVGGEIYIQENAALTSLEGLGSLSVLGNLFIQENVALTSLEGLDSLPSLGGYIYIYDNAALTSLDGLDAVASLGGYLYLSDNDAMTSLDGLGSLSSIGGYLYVSGNDVLTSLSGLGSLSSVDQWFYLADNASLCQDRVDSFVAGITIGSPPPTTTPGNDGTCPEPLSVTRATAWRNASKPGRVHYEGVVAGVEFASGLTFTVTDGGTLDQSGSVTPGDCTTGRNGRIRCAYRDPSVKKKFVRASFRPTPNADEYRYKITMNKLDVPSGQISPLGLTIDDGTTLYEGSATNCLERNKKLLCQD